jgi:hypothetical protein
MRTITIDILNEKVLNLLRDLELLKLIRLHVDTHKSKSTATHWLNYKGAMAKQTIEEIDQQLNELRNEWE